MRGGRGGGRHAGSAADASAAASPRAEAAKLIEGRFVALGAKEMHERGVGDDCAADGLEGGLEAWLPTLFKTLGTKEPAAKLDPARVTVARSAAPAVPFLPASSQAITLTKTSSLTPKDPSRNFLSLSFSGELVSSYNVGDALDIFPRNDPAKVASFLDARAMHASEVVEVQLADSLRKALPAGPITVGDLFSGVIDLWGKPSRRCVCACATRW